MVGSEVVALVIGFIAVAAVLIAFLIAQYVITALGMYRLAVRYQVANPWLAWIPVASAFLLGKITEVHDAKKGIKHKWSVLLLILSLVQMGGQFIFNCIYSVVMMPLISYEQLSYNRVSAVLVGAIVLVMIAAVVMALASVAYTGCTYVCIYKNLDALAPEKVVKNFLLSLLVPFAQGIILMKYCKKGYIEPVAMPMQAPQMNMEEMQASEYEYNEVPEDALEE